MFLKESVKYPTAIERKRKLIVCDETKIRKHQGDADNNISIVVVPSVVYYLPVLQ